MPNYCNFNMKIKGRMNDCEIFIKRMTDYNKPLHLWRIFEASVYNKEGNFDEYSVEISGYCAWSIESCCRASGYSEGVDLLEANTKELNLKLEVYSEEPGMCFQEHYIYDNGECLADECVRWEESWYDEEEDIEHESVGGFENWNWTI